MNDTLTANKEIMDVDSKKWLASLPQIIKKYEKLWSIKVSPQFKSSYNYVAPAIKIDGTNCVIKIGISKDREFQTEIDALEIFNGRGAVRLLESDKGNSVILIENILPGTPLSSTKDDDETTRIIASIIRTLVRPLPKKHKFITITEWMKAIPIFLDKYDESDSPLPYHLVEKANKVFQQLIITSSEHLLLHGDLHHDNILKSEEHGWLAIDPKGIVAEREFETAAMIQSPYSRLKNEEGLSEVLKKRIHILAAELDLDAKRIHKWCFAQSVLSAIWNDSTPKTSVHAINIAQVLDDLKF